jgi:streptomycin 6-kinase
MDLQIPSVLAGFCSKNPMRAAWLERLPGLVERLLGEWSATLDSPLNGEEPSCSFVAAVRCANGTPAVLKIGMPHMEAEDEIQGLRFWNGDPTVRLLDAEDSLNAMLLERCTPGTTLRALPEPEQDAVIATLLRRLWRKPSAPHAFRPLTAMLEHWTKGTLAQAQDWPDAGLVYEGLRLFRELPASTNSKVLLATDLHAGNVLRAEREYWLVIDPKPFLGDSAYDATQHLFNCLGRLRSNPLPLIQSFSDLLGVTAERVRLWTFARLAAEPRDDWRTSDGLAIARAISD